MSAKERKQVKGSLLIQLPKLCSIAKATNNGSQGCENPFFYWVGQKTPPFFFKHWLKIVYLHFYILCCCQGLNFGWASLHKPAKCNKISQRWKSHSSRSIFSNSEFLSFLQPRLSKVTSSGCFSLFENCAISNTSRRFSNHCNSNCVSWIAMCYNLQSIARAPVTIVSSSVDHRLGAAQPETGLVAGLPLWLDWSDDIDIQVQSTVWAPPCQSPRLKRWLISKACTLSDDHWW